MPLIQDYKVKVCSIRLSKDRCEINFTDEKGAYLSTTMTQEEAIKFKIDDEYIIQLRDVEQQLDRPTIDHAKE